MVHDIGTVIWKELREILRLRNSVRATVLSMILPVVFIGFFLSVNHGAEWVTSYSSLGLWFMLPYIMISGIIADSFAGERERHTLETLLSTPLSETSILVGKITATMCYGITLAVCGIVVSLITVNVTSGSGQFLMFTPPVLLSGIVLCLLAALTAASAGTLVSLKASSARQAQQMLGFFMMFIIFIPIIMTFLLPETVFRTISESLQGAPVLLIAALAVVAVLLFDVMLLGFARMRFKRSKMILD